MRNLVLLLAVVFTAGLSAQDSLEIGPIYAVSDTALVVVGRRDELATRLPYAVESVNAAAITRAQSLTTADALADLSGVYVQKSQFGGGSPVVRGFEANRVLLVVDGVRLNNAIYRAGHLQNAISVDPLALDRLEVIYGAGALAYGSDAIGGVIHFRTLQPNFLPSPEERGRGREHTARTQDAMSGKVSVAYGTAARALSVGGRLSYGAERWAGLTLLSTSQTSHLRAGAQRPDRYPAFGLRNEYLLGDNVVPNADPNVQVGTAYAQYNLLQKLRFRLNDRLELDANFQFSTTSNVPRYDALTERRNGQLRWAQWDYGPQTRTLASLRLQDRRPTALYDLATYLLSHQFVEEDRLQRRAGDPLREHNLTNVRVVNLQTDFSKILGLTTLRYGFDARYDQVDSEAFLQDISLPGSRLPGLASRYPSGGSQLLAGGLYADLDYALAKKWRLRGGLRYGYQDLRSAFGADDPVAWPAIYLAGVTNRSGALTAALGLRRNGERSQTRLLFAQGFRAPNLDDFTKFREQGGRIQVPSLGLKPERSHTLEASYTYAKEGLRAGLTLYHTWLNNAIVRRDGTLPDGSAFLVSRGDTLFAQTNVNAESARVYGADLSVSWRFSSTWTLRTEAHYLRGRRRQLAPDEAVLTLPQDHIPPPYGRTSLTYDRGPWTVDLTARYQLAKAREDYAVNTISGTAASGYVFDRMGTSDNLELTPFLAGEDRFAGTYGWWTLNVRAEYQTEGPWAFRLKVDNLLDQHYRTFASGVSAPGVDVGVGLTYRW